MTSEELAHAYGALDIPDREDYRRAVKHYEAKGYKVLGLCPECQWGLLLDTQEADRPGRGVYCTSYGQCEYAPG